MGWQLLPEPNNLNTMTLPDELRDYRHLIDGGNNQCFDDAFLGGNDESICFGSGRPIIIVPRSWPPHRDWNGDSNPPRKALIYLDDMIDAVKDEIPCNILDACGMPIDPIEELKAIIRHCKDHVEMITIYGSYWAANEFFKIVNKRGDRAVPEITNMIESINETLPNMILFKFVIARGCRDIQRSSAAEFLHY